VPCSLDRSLTKFTGKERGSESGIFNSGNCNPDQENCAGGSGFEGNDAETVTVQQRNDYEKKLR